MRNTNIQEWETTHDSKNFDQTITGEKYKTNEEIQGYLYIHWSWKAGLFGGIFLY